MAAVNDLVSPEEAAAFLKRSPATLALWRTSARRVNLPYYNINGRIQYSKADLDEFVAASRRVPEAM